MSHEVNLCVVVKKHVNKAFVFSPALLMPLLLIFHSTDTVILGNDSDGTNVFSLLLRNTGLSSLLEETELSPLQAETMEMIIASGKLLLCVVNDVLDYSKLQSGFVDIQPTKCNLQEIISSTAHCVQLKSEGGVTIETFYDAQVPEHFTTDPRRLQQILFNLLGTLLRIYLPPASSNGLAMLQIRQLTLGWIT